MPIPSGPLVAGALSVLLLVDAAAAPLPDGALERRCWLERTRERTVVNLREPTAVEFSNLRDGWRVRTPFVVEFAVRGMGVTPAGVKADGTGHHHILVDRDLPRDIAASIPFDDSHRHFGKGQTSTLLDLAPGKHRLRLLFADHDHRPHFVFSREITLTVLGPRASTPAPRIDGADFDATCRAWYEDETSSPPPPPPQGPALRFMNVRHNEPLVSPFNLRLAAEGFGIRAAGVKPAAEKTGHFAVELQETGPAAARKPPQVFDLINGATQLNLFVAAGDYRLRLRLLDERGADLAPPHEINVKVLKQEAL